MPEPTDRRWTDTDRELVARATFREAHDGGRFRWEDLQTHHREQAEAALAALAAAGRLADPQELAGGEVIAAWSALLDEAQAEQDRLRGELDELTAERVRWRSEVAEVHRLQGNVAAALGVDTDWDEAGRKRVVDAACRLVGNLSDAERRVADLEIERDNLEAGARSLLTTIDKLADEANAHEGEMGDLRAKLSAADAEVDELRARVAELEQPGRWELPPEPGPEVTTVWDVENVRWTRQHPSVDRWVCDEHAVWESVRTWGDLLPRGPLSATPPETAGGGQA